MQFRSKFCCLISSQYHHHHNNNNHHHHHHKPQIYYSFGDWRTLIRHSNHCRISKRSFEIDCCDNNPSGQSKFPLKKFTNNAFAGSSKFGNKYRHHQSAVRSFRSLCSHISTTPDVKMVNQKKEINSSEFIYTNDTPVVQLDAVAPFNALTIEEQHYAHYLSKACWFGSLIVLYQTSPESPLIFALFRRLFFAQSMDEFKSLAINQAKFTEEELQALLVYVAAFYANMGNYRGFGDSKFVPNLPKEKLENLIKLSTAYKNHQSYMDFAWDNCKEKMFSLNNNELSLGFPPNGITTYWSKNMTQDDEKIVKKFLSQNNLDAYNTRAFKDPKTGEYIVRFASIRDSSDPEERDYMDKIDTSQTVDGQRFRLERGDYSPLLVLVNKYLDQALKYAGNENEKLMIQNYIKHFRTGSLEAHKEGSRFWIKDKGPIVESYIGFIENYRDPAGQRAEFEGFVAMVNKEMTKKFTKLVENASNLLPLLPWPREFEKDRFLQPDFTSLDVLTFSGSGIPAGINIPNYDEIRQNEGFKNVSLGNVIVASLKQTKPNFLSEYDAKIIEKYSRLSFEVIVGLHELLGHGSGKLFIVDKDGKPNYDPEKTLNPLTGQKIQKHYQWNETYDSKFGSLSSPYEECRAECVGLYLSLNEDVMKIFGFSDPEEAKKVLYCGWMEMCYKGIESLKMYNPNVKKWLQAHSQARYVITRVLLEQAKDLVNIHYIDKSPVDGKPDLLINFTQDHQLIQTKGKKAIGDFLLKLQLYKSTGDIDSASAMFDHYSAVHDDLEYPYLKFREIAIARKIPRRLFVESSTELGDKLVQIKTFESKPCGLIRSFEDHLANEPELDSILLELWKKDADYFN